MGTQARLPPPVPRREGVARYENGGVYIGAFEREKRCGWGTHYFPDRTKYEGKWRNDIMEGERRFWA